jgi:glycosyltransferase involved in cell wall biosynthesis
MQGMQTALIVPAFNEEPVLGQMLDAIPPGIFQLIIVADNGSTDRTAEVAREHGAAVVHEPERGYGAACLKAIAALPPEIEALVFMQADLSEDAGEARNLLNALETHDLVLGSRTMGRADPGALLPHQVFGNWVATTIVRFFYGYRYTDLGPFRAIRRDALIRLGMKERNYGWTIEMQVRALEEKLRITEIPIHYRNRAAGENKVSGNTKASLMAGWKITSTVLKLWWAGQTR